MSLIAYVWFSLALSAIDTIGLTLWQIATQDFTLVPAVLIGVRLLLDATFVASNVRSLSSSRAEVVMLFWVCCSVPLGVWYWSVPGEEQYSLGRLLKDTVPAGMFFLKIGVIRSLTRVVVPPIKHIVLTCIAIAIANVAVFHLFGAQESMYVGLTPPVNAPIAWAVMSGSAVIFIALLGVVYLSGKRAYLVAAMAYMFAVLLRRGQYERSRMRVFLPRVLIGIAGAVVVGISLQGAIVEKFAVTSGAIEESGGLSEALGESDLRNLTAESLEAGLYLATAGRSTEVFRIIEGMRPLDWLIGHGAGFTYALELYDGTEIKDYANAHFSPLGLAYKYGGVFSLFFYIWLLLHVFGNAKGDEQRLFWQGVLLLFLIQSLFAFNVFVEWLLPLALVGSAHRSIEIEDGSRMYVQSLPAPLCAGTPKVT